jgi:Cu+-exporting ATPase
MQSEALEAHCPGCGCTVDPLRAGQVAILDGQFEYFCGSECKQSYLRAGGMSAHEDFATQEPPKVAIGARPAPAPSPDRAPEPFSSSTGAALAHRAPVAVLIEAFGIVTGLAAWVLGARDGVEWLRVILASAAWCAFAARAWKIEHDESDARQFVTILPATLATCAAVWGEALGDSHAMAMADLAGMACVSGIIVDRLVATARVRVKMERARIRTSLDVLVRVVHDEGPVEVAASEVRAGEPFIALAGDVIGVDAVISRGEARVVPWLGADVEVTRREGDPIVAGAKVTSRLLMTTTWSGRDRAWVKLLSAPQWRVDVAAPTLRTLRRAVEWGAPLASLAVATGAVWANASTPVVVASLAAGMVAAAAKTAPSFAALFFARAHLAALGRGITYRDAVAFERAGATDIAVFSARGTVLLGEPEVVAVEPVGPPLPPDREQDADQSARVLALAAGAETGSNHPFAIAILRAARARGIAPDHVRNINTLPGLGVTAIASSGERLVVGSRAIMLTEKVSGAVAEVRVSELQAEGRSVLLVALDDRLVGLIALQDGLRPGARAAVQKLLDVGIEPVLLSGESREMCETIGRALDIDHVRPEVMPRDRRAEVLALGEGGSLVSVVGHPTGDDQALGAADVAVAMSAAGATPGEWAVALASDDIAHAADALVFPRRARSEARIVSALALAPGIVALLALMFGAAPLVLAPLASMLGALAAALYVRSERGLSAA